MSLTRTDVAAAGAWTGPVSSRSHPRVVTGLSCWAMVEPLPSGASYQLSLRNASPSPEAIRATPVAAYQAPGATEATWWSHFVDDVSEARMPAQLPR
jgi:hypothetical protein